MKKFVILITISLLTSFAHSQTSKTIDSTTLPNDQLKLALKKIEQGKQCNALLEIANREIDLLNIRLSIKDTIIYNSFAKETAHALIEQSYKAEILNVDRQNKYWQDQSKILLKQLKRSKTKNFLTSVAGLAGMAVLSFLLLK